MKHLTKKLDWLTTLVPFLCILFLCILFIAFPEGSSSVLGSIRFFLGDQFGSFYLLMGLGAFSVLSMLHFPVLAPSVWAAANPPGTPISSGAP